MEETALNLAEARAVLVAAAMARAERAEMALAEWKCRCRDAVDAGAAWLEQQRHSEQLWREKNLGGRCWRKMRSGGR